MQPFGDIGYLRRTDLVLHRVVVPLRCVAFVFQLFVCESAEAVGDDGVLRTVHLQDGRAVVAVGGRGVGGVGKVGRKREDAAARVAQAVVERDDAALREARIEDVVGGDALRLFFSGDRGNGSGAVFDSGKVFVGGVEVETFDVVPAAHIHAVVDGDGAHGGMWQDDARGRAQFEQRDDGGEVVAVCAEAVQPNDAVCSGFCGGQRDSVRGLCHNFFPFFWMFSDAQSVLFGHCSDFVCGLRAEGPAFFAGEGGVIRAAGGRQ